MREVVAVQLGPEANGAGAHFWNFQDEAAGVAGAGGAPGEVAGGAPAPGALLRCSERGRGGGEVWAPRLVAVDLRGCRGSVRLLGDGGVDDDDDEGSGGRGDGSGSATWDGPAATFAQPRLERNAFLRCLDEEEPGEGWGDSGEGGGATTTATAMTGRKRRAKRGMTSTGRALNCTLRRAVPGRGPQLVPPRAPWGRGELGRTSSSGWRRRLGSSRTTHSTGRTI